MEGRSDDPAHILIAQTGFLATEQFTAPLPGLLVTCRRGLPALAMYSRPVPFLLEPPREAHSLISKLVFVPKMIPSAEDQEQRNWDVKGQAPDHVV
jgi:hypothetical protein